MKVRFIAGKKAGTVLEVPASTGVILISRKLAEFVPDEYGVARGKTAPYPIYGGQEPECTAIEPPENAMLPRPRPRQLG